MICRMLSSPPSKSALFTPKTVGIIAAVVTVTIWTSFIVVARFMALRSLTPLDIVFSRIIGASLILLPWGWYLVRQQKRNGQQQTSWLGLSPLNFKVTATIGLFGGIAYAVLAYSAFVYAPAAHGSVLLPGMLPLTTALLSVLVLNETLSKYRLIGLGFIMCGALLVGGSSIVKGITGGGDIWKGDLLFVCASSCWAFYTVTCRKHQLGAVPATIAVVVFCAVFFLPSYIALALSGLVQSKLSTAPLWEIGFQMGWQGIGSVVISGISFTKMVQYFGPIRSTMITALVPGLSALGAALFLNEPLYWNLLAGLALVSLGIIIGVRGQANPIQKKEAT
jgi:drug/metabolite transporter (DMT)-like permease